MLPDLDTRILAFLRRVDPTMAGDIAFELEVERADVVAGLERLRDQGRVQRNGLHWWLTSKERCQAT